MMAKQMSNGDCRNTTCKKRNASDEVSTKAFNPDTINLEFPSDKNGAAIDKVLQEEHDLIMVGDENQKMVLLTWKTCQSRDRLIIIFCKNKRLMKK